MRRTTNQDSHALLLADDAQQALDRGHLFMVADGMGAHAAGELASKLACDGVPHLYRKYLELPPPEALRRAIHETNMEIHRRGNANPDFHNMGTTCSVLVLHPQGAFAAHVGDSRIYRLRASKISQLTFDHSLQWELKASGQLPETADISAVVPKNVITRSLGPNPAVEIDIEGPHAIALGDVYLLCSDGLTGRVEDAELGAILASVTPHEAARALIDLANLRGGPDNTTVLIAKVVGPELTGTSSSAEPPATGAFRRRRWTHPAFWLIALACALAAAVMALMGYLLGAIVAAGASAVAILAAGIQYIFSNIHRRTRAEGRGPYTNVSCAPSNELVQKLAATLDELRDAAHQGEWSINWRPLDEHCQLALTASQANDYVEATRHYCRAISFVMSELRSQNTKKAGDSAVPY
jgi:protein phosphatase